MTDGSIDTVTTARSTAAGQSPSVQVASPLEMPLEDARIHLANLSAQKRLEWALKQFGQGFVLTTSFGIQSAVLLHMLHGLDGGSVVPVVWVDTGYLPAETYFYAYQLTRQLGLVL